MVYRHLFPNNFSVDQAKKSLPAIIQNARLPFPKIHTGLRPTGMTRQSTSADFSALVLFDSRMTFRNNLTLRSKQHRRIEKWVFGVIFVVTIMAICWLFL
jgi:hypothetical protein